MRTLVAWSRTQGQTQLLALIPLLIAMVLYGTACAGLYRAGTVAGDGVFAFPLDDAYINMSLGKHFAQDGVWGLSANRFAPAASAPGWILLLAAVFRIAGAGDTLPLAISFFFGATALIAAWSLLRDTNRLAQTCALLAIVLFSPLNVLGILGMETTLHMTLALIFLAVLSRVVADGTPLRWWHLLLAMAMVTVRFEGLFMVGMACLLLAGSRRIREALTLGSAALVPVVISGVISVSKGCYWLPNSIAVKASATGLGTVGGFLLTVGKNIQRCVKNGPHLVLLIALVLAALVVAVSARSRRAGALLAMVAGSAIIHMCLADVGWVFRYEAYLIAGGIAALAYATLLVPSTAFTWRDRVILGILTFLTLISLSRRVFEANTVVPLGCSAVRYQQVAMARFVQRFYQGAHIAANDVGAITFYADIDILDLVGLADRDVFWLKRRGRFSTEAMERLARERGVTIAIVYDDWFKEGKPVSAFSGPPLPASWVKAGEWNTINGRYVGEPVVSFYGTSPSAAEELRINLERFGTSHLKGHGPQ